MIFIILSNQTSTEKNKRFEVKSLSTINKPKKISSHPKNLSSQKYLKLTYKKKCDKNQKVSKPCFKRKDQKTSKKVEAKNLEKKYHSSKNKDTNPTSKALVEKIQKEQETRNTKSRFKKSEDQSSQSPSPKKNKLSSMLQSKSPSRLNSKTRQSPSRTASKRLELLIKHERKKSASGKSPESLKFKLSKMIKNTKYSNSVVCSFYSSKKQFAHPKNPASRLEERLALNSSHAGQEMMSCSYDLKRRAANASTSKFLGNAISVLNLKEDACKLLDKEPASRDSKTQMSLHFARGQPPPLCHRLHKKSTRKPRGQDLLQKIGKKSKSPEEKFRSQETKKNWGQKKFRRPKENSNFSSGKTVDGFGEMLELSRLKERTQLKRVKDIVELQDDDSLRSGDFIERSQLPRDYRTENPRLSKHIDELGALEDDSCDSADDCNYKTNRPNLGAQTMPEFEDLESKKLAEVPGKGFKVKSHQKGDRVRRLASGTWTDRKEPRSRLLRNIKFKKKLDNRSLIFSGKLNYSRVSLNQNKVSEEILEWICFLYFY